MYKVFVIDKDGSPLMPTTRFGKVRRMLDTGLAKVAKDKPFTIQLLYEPKTHVVQELVGGTDGGRTNIGNAVLDTDGITVYSDHVETCNKDVVKHMKKRAVHRKASHYGQRKKKKRRAKKNGTTTHKYDGEGRKLPRCKKATAVRDIINSEARFANRTHKYRKPEGRLTPSAMQLLRTHINHISNIRSILPVKKWTIELNKFSFMKLENGTIYGSDFCDGRLRGYKNAKEYVFARQGGCCAFCNKKIEEYHHIVPRCEGGFDGPENLLGLCSKHHVDVQNGKLKSKIDGERKKFAGTSVFNQALPYIVDELVKMFGEENVFFCSGWETKKIRDTFGIPKTHTNDAVCIAALGLGIAPRCNPDEPYEIIQFRNHNRAIINNQRERTYMTVEQLPDGKEQRKVVAKNRKKAMNQKADSLEDWFNKQVEEHGEHKARQMRSRLVVAKSIKRYNTQDRIRPGSIVKYKGKRHVLTGTLANEYYYRLYKFPKRDIPSKQCTLICQNDGLVYL